MLRTKVRHYRIEEKLSKSGIGEVYRAKDERLGREVAVKFLPKQLFDQSGSVARFIREARAASALNHPNIVTIYDTGDSKTGRYIVMELVRGRTLRDFIGQDLALANLFPIFTQITKALAAAHVAGVVHRDIKPENIMVRDDGYVKLLDFGLALWETAPSAKTPRNTRTASGTIMGTLRYMSPEQANGERVQASTDVFSLGVVLYELVTGKHPFGGLRGLEILQAICSKPVVPPSQWSPDIPLALENLILRMLERGPHLRPSAEETAHLLEEIEDQEPVTRVVPPGKPRPTLVGRHRERVQLRALLDSILHGSGVLALISGEPGMGKTTLVEDFLGELANSRHACAIGRGRCSERLAGTEAYLPFLEALENLVHVKASVARLMKRIAPAWYARVTRESTEDFVNSSSGQLKPVSRELLNRELTAFLEEASRTFPLVLFLDDVHWADESTIDLLTYLSTRFDTTRILILATYRPEELFLNNPRFSQIALDLQAHRRCHKIDLDFLKPADIESYLAIEFLQNNFPGVFSRLIHAKTEGNPFFMVEVLRYLRDKQVISEVEGTWTLSEKLPEIERDLPQSVLVMIQRKIDSLSDSDRRLLAAASVQGYEFDSSVVARVISMPPADVEERLDQLDRVRGLVQSLGEKEFPDRGITTHYRFVHTLYYSAFYNAIQPARKASWSLAAARALLESYQDHVGDIAGQVAFLFESARDFAQAARYFALAAQSATKIFAYNEAELLARRGLRMLEMTPNTPARAQEEFTLQLRLVVPLLATKGYGNLEVQQIYDRARQLCMELGENPGLFVALWGLQVAYTASLNLPRANDVGVQLMGLAQTSQDPSHLLGAHLGVGVAKFFSGEFEPAIEHLGRFRVLDNPASRVAIARRYGLEFGILMRGFEARILWYLGYPDKCVNGIYDALALARSLSHAPTLAFILAFSGIAHQLRGEIDQVDAVSKELNNLGTDHGLTIWSAEASFFRGWVESQRGEDRQKGIELMREGLTNYCATGTEAIRPYGYAVLAEVLRINNRAAEGLRLVRDVLSRSYMNLPYPIHYTADLFRVEGDLLADLGDGEAESRLIRALHLAREQKAKSFELRAAISLSKFWQAHDRIEDAREVLAEIYEWFSEGFETADLKEAEKQLRRLATIRKPVLRTGFRRPP